MKLSSILDSGITGSLIIEVFNEEGTLKDKRFLTNLVVTSGKNYMASRMAGTSQAVMSHMAVGSGSTAPANGNTTLGTELGRVALSSTSVNAATITYTAIFPAGTGTGSLTEAGIFNASSAGTLLCRTTFPVVNKSSGDSISITWTVSIN